jgi:polysaccharide pyruvyl transferase WcaK-like protein
VNRQVRRVAFCGYLGSGNIGNDATLEAVLAWLKSTHPEVELRCITTAPDAVSARYGIPSVHLAWHSSGQGGNRVKRASRKLLGRLLDVPRSYKLAGSVDAIVVPGMGVLEDTLGVRPWNLPLSLFLIAAACRVRGRPFVLLDVGADWAPNLVTRRLYVATAGLATHVSYRDSLSASAMRSAGARAAGIVAPDLAFFHPARTQAEPEPRRLAVGVMAYYGRRDDPIEGANVRRKYVAILADAIVQLAGAGDKVVLVGGDQVDVDVALEIRAAVMADSDLADDAVLVRELTTFSELTDEMVRADVVIASRFHNLICALRLARPTVSVGYARKNRHLMQALGLDEYCQDIEHLDAGQLVSQVRAARTTGATLAARIRRGTSDYADEVESLLERVAAEALGLPTAQSRGLAMHNENHDWPAG